MWVIFIFDGWLAKFVFGLLKIEFVIVTTIEITNLDCCNNKTPVSTIQKTNFANYLIHGIRTTIKISFTVNTVGPI
jgi:hypothetical protein